MNDRDVGPHRVSSMQVHIIVTFLQSRLARSMKPSIWSEAMSTSIYRMTLVHRRLDDEIRREHERRFPNSMRLLRLKKLRLAIKDRLHRLSPFGKRGKA